MIDNIVMFSIYVLVVGEYFFEVFVNKIEESNRFINFEEIVGVLIFFFRLKCICKFKVVCNLFSGKMYFFLDCVFGEWGFKKGY